VYGGFAFRQRKNQQNLSRHFNPRVLILFVHRQCGSAPHGLDSKKAPTGGFPISCAAMDTFNWAPVADWRDLAA